jgi:hypothetical protein
MVKVDPVLLEHLLQNFVANAFQYHRLEEAPGGRDFRRAFQRWGWQFAVK